MAYTRVRGVEYYQLDGISNDADLIDIIQVKPGIPEGGVVNRVILNHNTVTVEWAYTTVTSMSTTSSRRTNVVA